MWMGGWGQAGSPGFRFMGTASPASAKKSAARLAAPKYTMWPSDSRQSLSKSANTEAEGCRGSGRRVQGVGRCWYSR